MKNFLACFSFAKKTTLPLQTCQKTYQASSTRRFFICYALNQQEAWLKMPPPPSPIFNEGKIYNNMPPAPPHAFLFPSLFLESSVTLVLYGVTWVSNLSLSHYI